MLTKIAARALFINNNRFQWQQVNILVMFSVSSAFFNRKYTLLKFVHFVYTISKSLHDWKASSILKNVSIKQGPPSPHPFSAKVNKYFSANQGG